MYKIDVAKKVLTGGKIAPDANNLILKDMPTDNRYTRRIFNDYNTATDPNSIFNKAFIKNVYYTPFHENFYSLWTNVDRGDFGLGSPAEHL
jgi:hypothetical protein